MPKGWPRKVDHDENSIILWMLSSLRRDRRSSDLENRHVQPDVSVQTTPSCDMCACHPEQTNKPPPFSLNFSELSMITTAWFGYCSAGPPGIDGHVQGPTSLPTQRQQANRSGNRAGQKAARRESSMILTRSSADQSCSDVFFGGWGLGGVVSVMKKKNFNVCTSLVGAAELQTKTLSLMVF